MEKYHITYEEVYSWVVQSCTRISDDALACMEERIAQEKNPGAKSMLEAMVENVSLAIEKDKPVCQSPGYPTVYIRFGDTKGVDLLSQFLSAALVEATGNGYLRPSIVHPLSRHNPGNNKGKGVPNIEYRFVADLPYIEMIISFKGCGAELGNVYKTMTVAQLRPDGSGLKELVYETVINAGGMPCPPISLGIGLGGQMDVACKLSREAVSTRDWRDHNDDPELDRLEEELLSHINELGIGPAGIGGSTSCLAVKIGMVDTHTAICPVAINFHCWVARRMGVRIYPDGERKFLFQKGDIQ